LAKTFGQFATANYNFYTFVKEGLVFLVMVDSTVAFFCNLVLNKNRGEFLEKNTGDIFQNL
jgi:hypothetical protein